MRKWERDGLGGYLFMRKAHHISSRENPGLHWAGIACLLEYGRFDCLKNGFILLAYDSLLTYCFRYAFPLVGI